MNIRHVVAIDLGTSSGRVMLACYDVHNKKLSLDEIHRFTNHLITEGDHCYWDLDDLENQILIGLHRVEQSGINIDSIGIDTWGVDYVLLDREGHTVGRNFSYRDNRTQSVLEQAHHLLLIPDYLAYRLTGQINHEYTTNESLNCGA